MRAFQPPLTFCMVHVNRRCKQYSLRLNVVNIVVDIKSIYLNKRYLFQNKIKCLDKIKCFYFATTKLFKHTIKKETLAQVFSCEFCEISKNTFFTKHLWATASEQVTIYHYSACRRQNRWLLHVGELVNCFVAIIGKTLR